MMMSEMVRHRGIIKKLSNDKQSTIDVYKQLVADGKIDPKWDEVSDSGLPEWIESRDYTIVNNCIFDISGAPREYDGEDDVNDAVRLSETEYRIHSYFYNGGASLDEMLEESIPKADAAYGESSSKLTIEFPSEAHREAFSDWLSNSGEQGHYEQGNYVDEPNQSELYHLNFDYTNAHNGIITTKQVEE
jgi:hypothetical protein